MLGNPAVLAIRYIWDCACGGEQPCGPDDMRFGSVMRCHDCGQTWARLRRRDGSATWTRLCDAEVIRCGLVEAPGGALPNAEEAAA